MSGARMILPEVGALARSGQPSDPYALAIGVGFRKACSHDVLAAIIEKALRSLIAVHPAMAGSPAIIATIAEKDRPVLHRAAAALGLPVTILDKQLLASMEDRITVPSSAARTCFGISSVAEASALAAAGPGSRLLVARISVPDATCAIAAAAVLEAA